MYIYVRLFVVPWTVTRQAPQSMEFSRQKYWSGLSFPPPGDLPDAGIKPVSLAPPALAVGFFTTGPPGKPCVCLFVFMFFPIVIYHRTSSVVPRAIQWDLLFTRPVCTGCIC